MAPIALCYLYEVAFPHGFDTNCLSVFLVNYLGGSTAHRLFSAFCYFFQLLLLLLLVLAIICISHHTKFWVPWRKRTMSGFSAFCIFGAEGERTMSVHSHCISPFCRCYCWCCHHQTNIFRFLEWQQSPNKNQCSTTTTTN